MANNKNKKTSKKSQAPRIRGLRTPLDTGAAMSVERASKDELDNLVRCGALTQDGADWLVSAMDPFHDNARNIAGYPDIDSAHTTVTALTYTFEISSALANWQAHVFTLPVAGTTNGVPGTNDVGLTTFTQAAPTFAGGYPLRPINCIITAAANISQFPDAAIWNPAGAAFLDTSAVSTAGTKGYSRIIASGYEIINTTPVENKGGDLITYRMPAHPTPVEVKVIDNTAGNLVNGTAVYSMIRPPPRNPSNATALRKTCEWEAKHGVYVPIMASSIENPIKDAIGLPLMIGDTLNGEASFVVAGKAIGAAATTQPSYLSVKHTNSDIHGTFILGQVAGNTFRLKYTAIIESCPSWDEVENCGFSSPSAVYDPEALKLYSRLVTKMPIATYSGNNANGDWFKAILKTIHSIARPIASIFGQPARKFVDKVYGTANQVVHAAGRIFPVIP